VTTPHYLLLQADQRRSPHKRSEAEWIAVKAKAVKLLTDGDLSQRIIARRLGVDERRIGQWKREAGL
jgi:transposase-like protein